MGYRMSNVQQGISNDQVRIELLLFRLGGIDARCEDCNQLVTFIYDFLHATGLAQRFLFDDFQPNNRFSEFLECDFHLVNEISTRFRSLCFSVVRGG